MKDKENQSDDATKAWSASWIGRGTWTRRGEEHHHEYDPHLGSPHRAMKVESTVISWWQLIQIRKDVWENAQAYLKKLQALTAYQMAWKSETKSNFVTQHAAFRYLALDYGLNQVAISGISPLIVSFLLHEVNWQSIIRKMRSRSFTLRKMLLSPWRKPCSLKLVLNWLSLNPLESLTDQEMKDGEDYVSVMKENLKALERKQRHKLVRIFNRNMRKIPKILSKRAISRIVKEGS